VAVVLALTAFLWSEGTASAGLAPRVAPDVVLRPGESAVLGHPAPLVGYAGDYVGGEAHTFGDDWVLPPSTCRGEVAPRHPSSVAGPLLCAAYRIAVDPGPAEKPNVVYFRAAFDEIRLPEPSFGSVTLAPPPLDGLDVFVWDTDGHYLGRNDPRTFLLRGGNPSDRQPGGRTVATPEIGSFDTKQRLYDIVVMATTGVNRGFTLTLSLSDEVFAPQVDGSIESLPPAPTAASTRSVAEPHLVASSPAAASDRAAPPSENDRDLSGVGLGITNSFDVDLAMSPRTRYVAAGPPPSALLLVVGLVAVPALVATFAVAAFRRRYSMVTTGRPSSSN
jgi:hypothetical protein